MLPRHAPPPPPPPPRARIWKRRLGTCCDAMTLPTPPREKSIRGDEFGAAKPRQPSEEEEG